MREYELARTISPSCALMFCLLISMLQIRSTDRKEAVVAHKLHKIRGFAFVV